MPTYTLSIAIDQQGVSNINGAGQYVTIVKQVGSGLPVAWVTFSPMESNTVTWTDEYSVYASTTNAQDGAQIFTESSLPAIGGDTYTLANGAFTQTSSTGLGPTTYGVLNQDQDMTIDGVPEVTSGLYLGAVVNGNSMQSPLNAAVVMYNEEGQFTPIEKIFVFLSAYSDNGFVLSSVASNALEVDYTTTTTASIVFNDQSNTFQPAA